MSNRRNFVILSLSLTPSLDFSKPRQIVACSVAPQVTAM